MMSESSVKAGTGGVEDASSPKSFKIQKRKASDLDDDEDLDESGPSKSNRSREEVELQAEQEMQEYLKSKSVSAARIKPIKVIVRDMNKKGPGASMNTYSIKYKLPSGVEVGTKEAILPLVLPKKSPTSGGGGSGSGGSGSGNKSGLSSTNTGSSNKNATSAASVRKTTHEAAKKKLQAASGALPVVVGGAGLRVLDFGKIADDPTHFQNQLQLYPVGYKAEITIEDNEVNRAFVDYGKQQALSTDATKLPAKFNLIIKQSTNNTAIFVMENVDTKISKRARTEKGVFREHFPGISPEQTWLGLPPFSFFNLQVELLIEGLPKALLCSSYRFHAERGYGDKYTDQKTLTEYKMRLLAQREEGGNEKGNEKGGKSNVSDALMERRRKRQEEKEREKANEKASKQLEAAQKAQQKLNLKEMKARQREQQREAKKQKVLEEAANKKAKAQGLQAQAAFKYRTPYRQDARKQIFKAQKEVLTTIVERFDAESKLNDAQRRTEENFSKMDINGDAMDEESVSGNVEILPLEQILEEQVVSCGDGLKVPAEVPIDDTLWDQMFRLSNFLTGQYHHLSLEHPVVVNQLVENFCNIQLLAQTADDIPVKEDGDEKEAVKQEESLGNDTSVAAFNVEADEDKNMKDMIKYQSIAEMDRIQLCLVQATMKEVHKTLDLDDVKLPLNQLTWPEVARMALLQFTLRELMQVVPMHKDDIQNMIRGSKTPHFRQFKNVVRGIRYRMLARNGRQDHGESIEESNVFLDDSDRLVSINSMELKSKSVVVTVDSSLSANLKSNFKFRKAAISQAPANNFEDVDMVAFNEALITLVDKENVPEVYKRCAKVLYKVANYSQSKNFMWDSAFYREFLQFVKKPMVLSNVATKLILQEYGKGSDYNRVAMEFYEDMKACVTSQLAFYSESHAFLAQGHKLLTVIWRHVQQWVLSKDKLALDSCSESYCLLSGNKMEEKETRMKCGRCNGFFCLNALHGAKESPFLIQPTQILVDKQNFEEWVCMYCVQEDSAITRHIPRTPILDQSSKTFWDNMDACYASCFFIDEHGPSAMIPWQLHPGLNRSLQGLSIRMSSMKRVCNALSLLSQSSLTPNLHCKADKAAWKSSNAAVWPTSQQTENKWSIQSRLSVLMALADLLQNTDKVYEDCYESAGKLCEKLLKHTSSSSFKETDFLRAISDLTGDEGYKLAKGVLKQINAERARSDYLSADVRGVIEAIDSYKNKEEEEPILNRLIDIKAALDPKEHKNAPKELLKTLLVKENEKAEVKCQYCGYSEVDVGSPFVLGQSPAEHQYHVDKYGDSAVLVGPDGLIEGEMNTTVKFFTNGFELKPGAIEMPYYPILSESDGKTFVNALMKDQDPDLALAPIIVHKHCAMHMFKARLEHKSHELRRQRRRLAERMIAMSGVHTVPLGKDRKGREYWKFPKTNALFICSNVPQDTVQQDFCDACDKSNINSFTPIKSENNDLHYNWTMTSDRGVIENIINALPASVMDDDENMKNQVLNLQQNLKDMLENEIAFPLVKEEDVKSQDQDQEENQMKTAKDNETSGEASTGTDVVSTGETDATPSTNTGETATEEKAENGAGNGNGDDAMVVEDNGGADATAETSFSDPPEPTVVDLSNDKETAVPMERQKRAATNMTSWLGAPTQSAPPTTGPALPEDQPVALTHLPHKGVSFEAVYEIEAESAFEEQAMFEYEDMPEDDSSYEQYFTFSQRARRFIVLQLSNAYERKVKLPAQSEVVAVNYKITREGQDLMITDIRQQWSDGLYYFYMPVWRRTGKYTLTFWTEALDGYTGPPLNLVKPLVFEINVQARRRICGIPDAVAKLQASKFVHKSGRRSMIDKIRFLSDFRDKLSTEVDMSFVEIDALKSCLFTIFVALPQGSLMIEEDESAYTGVTSGVAEAIGWNDSLEDVWFTSLEKAKTAMEIMECVLLLEHYLNKSWFFSPQNQLMTALPAPHFAMRCITLSSVALRIFCIDKCLNYSKVEAKSRSKRASGRGGIEEVSSDRSRSRGKPTQYYDESDSEDENEEIYAGRRGSQRAAAGAAQARIRAIADDIDDSPRGVRESARNRADDAAAQFAERGPADSWSCAQCTFSNALRARNCGACGAKRSVSLQQTESSDSINTDNNNNHDGQQEDTEEMPVDDEDESPPPASGPVMITNRKKKEKKVVESDEEEEEDYKENEEEEEEEEDYDDAVEEDED